MCGIIFSHTRKMPSKGQIEVANISIGKRGPDQVGLAQHQTAGGHWVTMVHSLLDISGHATKQPYTDVNLPDKFLIFNGEIYNHKNFSQHDSDTVSILRGYANEGDVLFENLRGEFAVLIYDKIQEKLEVFTDPFLTKPIFIGRSDIPSEICIASYPSALQSLGFHQIQMAEPNTHYSFQLSSQGFSVQQRFPVVSFALQQTQSSYKNYFECLVEAVRLRALHGAHTPALSLSSGYDSGAICLALNLLGLRYQTVSVNSGENEEVMRQRLSINEALKIPHHAIEPLRKAEIGRVKNDIRSSVEPYQYAHKDEGKTNNDLSSDSGAIGAYVVAQRLKSLGVCVNLSGSGADEIYSDYGHNGQKIYPHSEFGGLFPNQLEGFFPWKKFYGDTQRSYLFKEEIIFGHFGIESRYPLLDRELVQEFLALSPELKNLEYKAPIAAFLRQHNYPFEPNKKRGFSARDLPLGKKIRRRFKSLFS
jgi:asparagine synthetase B (glutamine-hydrolysing)